MGVTGPVPAVRSAVLAIDAGNSKTDVCVVSADGELLGSARGGPFRPHLVGAGPAVAGLAPTVEEALARAGTVELRHVAACLANADLEVEHEALESAIAATGWAPSHEVVNDTFALLRAGLDESRGVAVICGAGINCTGVLPDGTTVRFAAVGHISGDWGGGGHLWQEAMWWAARAEDGRGPDTALRTALPHHVGLDSMAALIEAVHLGTLPEERCMELTPVLFEVADTGDEVAAEVVRRQAHEVVALAATAIRRLGVAGQPIDVVLGGGVLTAGHRGLMDEIRRRLADEAPRATVRVVGAPPIVGAALLALDRVGASPAARDRLRESWGDTEVRVVG
jgi:N-acetylglucosamine kinase-like BadF-type ATPase